MIKLKDALIENLKYIDSSGDAKEKIIGVTTGFKGLDGILGGLRPGKLIVIGGRLGMGKTALALRFAVAAARQTSRAVAVFSYDNLYSEISMRLLSAEARVALRNLQTKELEEKELTAISKAVQRLADLHLYIEDSVDTDLDQMYETCLKLKTEAGLAMIVIDYFQLIPMSKSTLENTVKSLKNMAVQLEVPVVILSQLKKSSSRLPRIKELQNVGTLETSAEVICFINREEFLNPDSPRKGIADIFIERNRFGGIGYVSVAWNGSQARLSEFYEV